MKWGLQSVRDLLLFPYAALLSLPKIGEGKIKTFTLELEQSLQAIDPHIQLIKPSDIKDPILLRDLISGKPSNEFNADAEISSPISNNPTDKALIELEQFKPYLIYLESYKIKTIGELINNRRTLAFSILGHTKDTLRRYIIISKLLDAYLESINLKPARPTIANEVLQYEVQHLLVPDTIKNLFGKRYHHS
jgi:hypothetical protein